MQRQNSHCSSTPFECFENVQPGGCGGNHTITSVGTHEEVRKNNAYYRNAWKDYETARNITYQLEGGEQHE